MNYHFSTQKMNLIPCHTIATSLFTMLLLLLVTIPSASCYYSGSSLSGLSLSNNRQQPATVKGGLPVFNRQLRLDSIAPRRRIVPRQTSNIQQLKATPVLYKFSRRNPHPLNSNGGRFQPQNFNQHTPLFNQRNLYSIRPFFGGFNNGPFAIPELKLTIPTSNILQQQQSGVHGISDPFNSNWTPSIPLLIGGDIQPRKGRPSAANNNDPWGPLFHHLRPNNPLQAMKPSINLMMSNCIMERRSANREKIPDILKPICDQNGDYAELQYAGYPGFCYYCVHPKTNTKQKCSQRLKLTTQTTHNICEWS